MADPRVLRDAYILGCKIAAAQINNANDLQNIFMSGRDNSPMDSADRMHEKDPVLSNQEEESKSLAGANWGPKHQLAANPEWIA